jgi:hypothetical protein
MERILAATRQERWRLAGWLGGVSPLRLRTEH